jgi:hypothetical protein
LGPSGCLGLRIGRLDGFVLPSVRLSWESIN